MKQEAKTAPSSSTRRRFFRYVRNAFIAGGGMLGWTVFVEPHWLSISVRKLAVANLPTAWIGRRMIHVSDLHVGSVNLDYLFKAVRQINSLQPDVLVVTGDFINHDFPAMSDDLKRLMNELLPGKLASLACLGNHDYGHRWAVPAIADRVVGTVEQSGFRILRDEVEPIEGVDFFGLDDYWTPNFEAAGVLSKARPDRASICLCHNPDVCDEPVWSDFKGVILSGHTHGGQCKPPFLPAPITPIRNKLYAQGFCRLSNDRTLYVNRGLGYLSRVRFNCRPEITVFELSGRLS